MLKISIITVSYNSAATIEDTIDSIASQNYPMVEHIVIDGASKDATVEIVRSSPSVTRMVSEPDKGIYDAMNKGISLATGDVIGILNADDFYADETVLSQVAEVFTNPDVEACYADLVYVKQADTSKIVRYWQSQKYRPGLFRRGWMPAHPTFFVRREVYERLGGFDLRFPRQADFELTMRFLEVYGIKWAYVPRIWVKMRTGGVSNNSILGVVKGNIEAYHACKLHQLDIGPLFILCKILSRLPQFFTKPSPNIN